VTICFDTNVLAYAIDATAGRRHGQAAEIVRAVTHSGRAVLILQTAAEFYAVATRKLETTPQDARAFLARLRAVLPVHGSAEPDLDKAMVATEHHGMSFWDAMLWATADRVGVRYLLTEDFQDGRTLGGVTFVDPFKSGNAGLLTEILPAR
jgi:predicted nucleic acid-binding protein